MTIQSISLELAVIQKESKGSSLDNLSIVNRCKEIQRQIAALPKSVDASSLNVTLRSIYTTLLQPKLRENLQNYRERITRLETLEQHSGKLSLLKKTFEEAISVEKELKAKNSFFSSEMALIYRIK